jgi:hypothetical protein
MARKLGAAGNYLHLSQVKIRRRGFAVHVVFAPTVSVRRGRPTNEDEIFAFHLLFAQRRQFDFDEEMEVGVLANYSLRKLEYSSGQALEDPPHRVLTVFALLIDEHQQRI